MAMAIEPAERLEALYRRLHAYLLGGIDMHDALETAKYLRGDHVQAAGHEAGMPWRTRRTLETGMFITYARPFTDARRPGLPRLKRAPGLSQELRDSHRQILERRHRVYAHTDDSPLRQILEIADPRERAAWVSDQGDLSEQWFPPTREMLDDVVALAGAHLSSFLDQIEKTREAILQLENELSLTQR